MNDELSHLDEAPEATRPRHDDLFEVTLSSIGDGVITTTTDGRVEFMNGVAEELTGWSHAEAAGVPLDTVFRIVNEDTRVPVENPATRALREGIVVGLANHTLLIAKDGVERPIDDSAAPIRRRDRSIAGVVLVFRDVTERRRAERALKQSEERFRLLVESVQDYAIFLLDTDGRIASWNLGAERIKGYRASEIVGQHFSRFYPADAVAAGWPDTELAIAREVGRFEDEGWRVRKDGSTFWANVVITALRDETGELRGYAKVTRDLTQRRMLERARTETEVLVDLDRRKDEFLAMLSHELRNPLAPLRNATHILRLEKDDNPTRQHAVGVIDRQVANLTRLIDDLLEVSRVATGRVRIRHEHVDLRVAIEHAVDTVRPMAAEGRIRLSVDVPDEALPLLADPARMEQVLVNLLTNAVKYNREGGSVWIEARRAGREAVVTVRDDGLGIAPDLLPHVFELFTQAHQPFDRSGSGLGVGLTIVRRLVELHGGTVEASSEGLGKGSSFVLRLPIVEPGESVAGSVEPAAPSETRALRVLVVDDNADAADTMVRIVQALGHDARVAYASASAIRLAAELRPDVLLLDIGLPEMDGYKLARYLRAQPGLANACLVAVSGYAQPVDRARSESAGFRVHLAKPVEPEELRDVLARAARGEV